MAGKFHFNPETGKTGVCKASVRECDFKLSKEEHFETEQEAKEAYQKTMNSNLFTTQSKPRTKPKNVKEMNIDIEISAAAVELEKAEAKLEMEEASLLKAQSGKLGYSIEKIEKAIEIAKSAIAEKRAAFDKANSKYEGWSRYVAVPGGHVHNIECSTLSTYKTKADRGLAVEASGLDEDELIELAGERACTVCFPDAPVTKRPSMLKEDVKIREVSDIKLKEQIEKTEKKRLASLRDDGKAVIYDGSPHRTMRSLEIALNNDLFYAMRGVDAMPPEDQNFDQETLDWYKDHSATVYEKIESMREILSERYEEVGKEFDFDAFIEKKKKAHLKDFSKSGWKIT